MTRPPQLPQRITTVIFDFDETMIHLEAQHSEASQELCRAMGSDYDQMPLVWRRGSGRRVIDDVRDLRNHFGWSESLAGLFERRQLHFDTACRSAALQLLPGVERAIRALHATGLALAIASSAVGSSIDATLRRLGVRHFFSLIVDGSDVVHGKPDPEAYLVTARKLGVAAGECVVFEDSQVGVAAAKSAGMCCIAVRNPQAQSLQDLEAADLILDSFEDFELQWVRPDAPNER